MTATYSPFLGDFGAYGADPEHPWFSYSQPQQVNVDPNPPAQTSNGGFLGSGFPVASGGGSNNSVLGFLNSLANPDAGGAVGPGSPNVSSGPTQGVNANVSGIGNMAADAISIAMSAMGLPSLGMAPAIANMLGLTSSINMPGIATVDENTGNINDSLAAIASQVAAAATAGIGNSNMGTSTPAGLVSHQVATPSTTSEGGTPATTSESPGTAAGGPGASSGTSSGTGTSVADSGPSGQSDNALKRGGFIRPWRHRARGGPISRHGGFTRAC